MAERKFINLTPHAVTIYKSDGTVIEIPPKGEPLRLAESDIPFGEVEGIPIIKREFSLPTLAEELYDPNNIVIVSLPTLLALKDLNPRPTALVVAPDTGKGAVRDEAGRIVGTTALITM